MYYKMTTTAAYLHFHKSPIAIADIQSLEDAYLIGAVVYNNGSLVEHTTWSGVVSEPFVKCHLMHGEK